LERVHGKGNCDDPHTEPTDDSFRCGKPRARGVLSVGALCGGSVLIVAPRGEIMSLPLSALADSPFETDLGPGLILLTVLGLGPLGLTCRTPSLASYSLVHGLIGPATKRRQPDLGQPAESHDRDHGPQDQVDRPPSSLGRRC
jgi:hypothetical protein